MSTFLDDLSRPLGLDRHERIRKPSLLLSARKFAWAAVGCVALGLGVALFVLEDPLGGEPHVIVAIGPKTIVLPPVEKAPPPPSATQDTANTAAAMEEAAGVSVVRGGDEAAPNAVVIRLPEPVAAKLVPSPDRRLAESTRYGILPKIGPDGARAADVYARPVGDPPPGMKVQGRIALVMGGLGISTTATAEAIVKLPGPVTLAFAPYGADLERAVARARGGGHEVMLQAPMEPFDYPDNDPGPHTLLAGARTPDNMDKLHWVMGRFTGYTGVINFMGAKLTADDAALAPILKDIGERGLLFLDDGSSQRSRVGAMAASAQVEAGRADSVIDSVLRPDAIDKELARLEETARKQGLAIATATALPLTVDRVALWAKTLESKGLLLIPASAALHK